ncbi:MAG: zinc ABC transporter substrate-binding protein [Spirochaetales bacterium]|nr:zinc ABC transporter substrate-binding protein [Spirochaetales bacterium]
MSKRPLSAVGPLLLVLLILISCIEQEKSANISVIVSITPQKYFVERVGGEFVEVTVLVQPGDDPHLYSPTPRQIEKLINAKIYFLIGESFEEIILSKLAAELESLRIVDTIENIRLRTFKHTDHDIQDPHTWLDPLLVVEQAKIIRDTLMDLDPAHSQVYENNFLRFKNELIELDRTIRQLLESKKGGVFFVFHPAYGYFADAYGLVQVAVESGGKNASAKELEHTMQLIEERGIRTIFTQPNTAENDVRAVAEAMGGRVVSLDPLAYDYQRNLLSIARAIKRALE